MKYPYDIVSYVRKKTFSIEAHFTRELDESPLKMFAEPFSRYVFTVIENGKAATANVPISCVEKLFMDTQKIYMNSSNEKGAIHGGTSPAYTVRFVAGKNRGKTPAEVLAQPNGKDILNSEYRWLKENLGKYPGNQKIMDAIIDASKLDPKEVSTRSKNASAPITLLSIGQRPLIRKKRPDGMCFVYEVSIEMDFSRDYPVTVFVTNYYAPVIKTDKGLLNVQSSKMDKSSLIRNSFAMTMEEWLNAVFMMKDAKEAYYFTNFRLALNLADEASKKQREEFEKAKAGAQTSAVPAAQVSGPESITDASEISDLSGMDEITDLPIGG